MTEYSKIVNSAAVTLCDTTDLDNFKASLDEKMRTGRYASLIQKKEKQSSLIELIESRSTLLTTCLELSNLPKQKILAKKPAELDSITEMIINMFNLHEEPKTAFRLVGDQLKTSKGEVISGVSVPLQARFVQMPDESLIVLGGIKQAECLATVYKFKVTKRYGLVQSNLAPMLKPRV